MKTNLFAKRKKMPIFPIYQLTTATAISPIDGRYNAKTNQLSKYFSEFALMRYRLLVSVEWFIFLSVVPKIIRPMTKKEKSMLRNLYAHFSDDEFRSIKFIEKKTNHDVNAVVRYLKVWASKTSLVDLEEFVHFGLTSEDINNTAYAFMLRGGVRELEIAYRSVLDRLLHLVNKHQQTPLLALTHGQPASPTTVGWEMNIFLARLVKQLSILEGRELSVKFGGATGGHNALNVAWPDKNWRAYSGQFINRLNRIENLYPKINLNFSRNYYTTQRENQDTYVMLFDNIKTANKGLINFCQDMWIYISQRVFVQQPKGGEDGSSAMPHKVNPIDFENAEGNFGMANVMFEYFAEKLPISRLQRDLSDSTVIRNFGTAFAHTLLALTNLEAGLGKVYVNTQKTTKDLDENWAVIAEAIQTILRREGIKKAYDLLKDLTRGKAEINEESMGKFISVLIVENKLSEAVAAELKSLRPDNYIGDRKI